jgi:tripartite-type tricarboxylate transporter receptor subunit TctC
MRAVAEYATKKFGSPVIVVNKPGGGAVPGIHYALKEAKPDGYTLLADGGQGTSMMVAAMLNPPIKLEDRVFLGRINVDPTAFAVRADAPWKNLKELNDWVKAHPKELTWGSTGPFGASAFGTGEWLTAIGVNPFDTRMVTSMGWGEHPSPAGRPYHVSLPDRCRVLGPHKGREDQNSGRSGRKRSPFLPDVPTAAEAGTPGTQRCEMVAGISVASGSRSTPSTNAPSL